MKTYLRRKVHTRISPMVCKDPGDANVVSAMICTIIGILVFTLMVIMMLDYSKLLDTKNSIYTICDAYLEQMMADGYLTPEQEDNLIKELAELGVDHADCSNSTCEQIPYGGRVVLEVHMDMVVSIHRVTELLVAEAQDGQVQTIYKRAATSYH